MPTYSSRASATAIRSRQPGHLVAHRACGGNGLSAHCAGSIASMPTSSACSSWSCSSTSPRSPLSSTWISTPTPRTDLRTAPRWLAPSADAKPARRPALARPAILGRLRPPARGALASEQPAQRHRDAPRLRAALAAGQPTAPALHALGIERGNARDPAEHAAAAIARRAIRRGPVEAGTRTDGGRLVAERSRHRVLSPIAKALSLRRPSAPARMCSGRSRSRPPASMNSSFDAQPVRGCLRTLVRETGNRRPAADREQSNADARGSRPPGLAGCVFSSAAIRPVGPARVRVKAEEAGRCRERTPSSGRVALAPPTDAIASSRPSARANSPWASVPICRTGSPSTSCSDANPLFFWAEPDHHRIEPGRGRRCCIGPTSPLDEPTHASSKARLSRRCRSLPLRPPSLSWKRPAGHEIECGQTDNPAPAFLVFNETYDPGWALPSTAAGTANQSERGRSGGCRSSRAGTGWSGPIVRTVWTGSQADAPGRAGPGRAASCARPDGLPPPPVSP